LGDRGEANSQDALLDVPVSLGFGQPWDQIASVATGPAC
jgi:hypothetical protein